jgi:NDP-sugar pyrophosphorylase family protein
MKIIIPMAGLGSRFQKASDTNEEYKKPKPFIHVHGIPMVRWATGALPFIEHPGQTVTSPLRATPKDLIFIVLKEHDDAHKLAQGLKEIYSDAITVIIVPTLTRGASETAYQAKKHIDDNEEVIITDSDHYFDGKAFEDAIIRNKENEKLAGIIPVFTPPADDIPRWSYSLAEKDSTNVLRVGEKDRALMEAGAYANIGAYYFKKAKYFFDLFEEIERDNKMFGEEGKKEFYVAPMYQELLEKNMCVECAILDKVWGLGTPADLEHFLANGDRKMP